MRTTITLDPDVETLVKNAMRERGLSFKEAVNDAIRAGMVGQARATPKPFPAHDMGQPLIDVTKALRLASELEDQDLAARLERGG